jgi:hypothetical protein
MTTEMELVVGVDGVARCIYDETLDLRELGKLQITRASHVEPDADGYWWADMGPSGGPVLGPFRSRSEALGAERAWLEVTPFEKSSASPQTPVRLVSTKNTFHSNGDVMPLTQGTTHHVLPNPA